MKYVLSSFVLLLFSLTAFCQVSYEDVIDNLPVKHQKSHIKTLQEAQTYLEKTKKESEVLVTQWHVNWKDPIDFSSAKDFLATIPPHYKLIVISSQLPIFCEKDKKPEPYYFWINLIFHE